jgi:CHASE2 domain-containing sensor protein
LAGLSASELRRILLRPSVLSVLLIVTLWNVLASSEKLAHAIEGPGTLREVASGLKDVNGHLQFRMYQILFWLLPYNFKPRQVTLVFINDAAHWSEPLWGNLPTDRAYLAQLVANASQPATKARVIGLDVELISPVDIPGVDDPNPDRRAGNSSLLTAIKKAASNGVPVVIATAFGTADDGSNHRLAGIFQDSDLPLGGCAPRNWSMGCSGMGYIDAPEDRRQIPLAEETYDWNGSSPFRMNSFALAVVNADPANRGEIRDDPVVRDALVNHSELFGTFVPEAAFKNRVVEASKLHDGDLKAITACSGRIVLIGGRWHEWPGYGSLVDTHFSPVGWISGLSFHANYIESLENEWYRPGVPAWVGILIDLLAGLTIYVWFASFKGFTKLIGLASAFLLIPLSAYIFFVNFNRYLDFLFPMELYVLHIAYEWFKELWPKYGGHDEKTIEPLTVKT